MTSMFRQMCVATVTIVVSAEIGSPFVFFLISVKLHSQQHTIIVSRNTKVASGTCSSELYKRTRFF